MKIMSYNIHSGKDMDNVLDIPGISRVIFAEAPDILALNEVRMGTTDVGGVEMARVIGEDNGMEWRFGRTIYIAGGEYGNAILSRWPIRESTVVPVAELSPDERKPHYEPRAALSCLIETPVGLVRAITCHFGLNDNEQVEAVKTVCSLIDDGIPTIFMGDLNVTPDNPVLAPIRGRLTDTAGAQPLTFSARAPYQKIDYIFLSSHFAAGPLATRQTLASDHLPIFVQATLKGHTPIA